MAKERILFVTGRLAEIALREVLEPLRTTLGDFDLAVLNVNVAALLTTSLVASRLELPASVNRVILPGWCRGDVAALSKTLGIPCELGPKDLYDLPSYLGRGTRAVPELSAHRIEILAEINHAPQLTRTDMLTQARRYQQAGADVIDLGCLPGASWSGVADAVSALRDLGCRVSVDSFDRTEVEAAVAAGAELVLSCNSTNIDWARRLPCELVAIPDDPRDLASLDRTVSALDRAGTQYRLDPILEPIGYGFAASLERYLTIRQRYPHTPMMMGVGNVTELAEVDSSGVNLLLAAFCEELSIGSILTTEVIPWCQTAVREFEIARRMVHYAIARKTLAKHLTGELLLLRGARVRHWDTADLARLAAQLKDPNFRLFAEAGEIHVMNCDGWWHHADPYAVFDQVLAANPQLTPDHTFYLGYELSKARTALTLGKQYVQDEALNWGFLTQPEESALERRSHRAD